MSYEKGTTLPSLSLTENRDSYVNAAQLCTKVDSLLESCIRLRYMESDGVKWSDIVDDYSSLSTAFRLLRDALSISSNQLCVTPHDLPEDVHMITIIPDILSSAPSSEEYSIVEDIKQALHLDQLNLETKRTFSGQDPRQLRLQIQKFNSEIDNARENFSRIATNASFRLEKVSRLTNILQPSPLKPVEEQKSQEGLYEILTRLYRGTSLCPPPLRPREVPR